MSLNTVDNLITIKIKQKFDNYIDIKKFLSFKNNIEKSV